MCYPLWFLVFLIGREAPGAVEYKLTTGSSLHDTFADSQSPKYSPNSLLDLSLSLGEDAGLENPPRSSDRIATHRPERLISPPQQIYWNYRGSLLNVCR